MARLEELIAERESRLVSTNGNGDRATPVPRGTSRKLEAYSIARLERLIAEREQGASAARQRG
jgi:hypothetical protein